MTRKHSLPPEMTIYSAGATRAMFQEWVARLPKGRRGVAAVGAPVLVDSSAVLEVDASGVQLLLSLYRTMAAANRTLKLESPSTRLAAACQALGASSLLPMSTTEGVAT
jgi:anti-anti-sigma regulatory factor